MDKRFIFLFYHVFLMVIVQYFGRYYTGIEWDEKIYVSLSCAYGKYENAVN